MHGFWKQKIDFLTLDKIFVLDNLNIVLDRKYFVRADGWGIGFEFELNGFQLSVQEYFREDLKIKLTVLK